jgi:2-phospho-L-lactate guanylyltransferase
MSSTGDIWAVVPIKETSGAKQRLADLFPASFRRRLALAMFEDVMRAVTTVPELRGTIVVTMDPAIGDIAQQLGAQVWTEGARDGHTGAVTAAARRLGAGGAGMLTLPGDIPLISASDIQSMLHAHAPGRAFTIAPARDELGSNAVLCSPADVVPLRFGADSFFPHLDAARRCGLEPRVIKPPAIGLDIDEPADVAAFMRVPSVTATRRLLEMEWQGPPKKRRMPDGDVDQSADQGPLV